MDNIYDLLKTIIITIGVVSGLGVLFYFISGGFERPPNIYDSYNLCIKSCLDGWGRLKDVECLRACEKLLNNKTEEIQPYKICFNCTCITPYEEEVYWIPPEEDFHWEGEDNIPFTK